MKPILAILLLAPAVAMAQQAKNPMTDPQMFAQMKQMMMPQMQESLPAMEQTRSCVSASQNSADLNGCVEIMTAFQNKMRANMPKPPQGAPGHNAQQPAPPKLEWTPELKEKLMADIGTSIKNTNIAIKCMQQSSKHEEMRNCMQANGIQPGQGPGRGQGGPGPRR